MRIFVWCGLVPLQLLITYILVFHRRHNPFTVERLAHFEFFAEVYVFSALFIYIRIVDARHYKICTSLGNIYSGIIFVFIGILTMICAMFGVVFTILLIFNFFRFLCRKYCCCFGGLALVPKRLAKIPYDSDKF